MRTQGVSSLLLGVYCAAMVFVADVQPGLSPIPLHAAAGGSLALNVATLLLGTGAWYYSS